MALTQEQKNTILYISQDPNNTLKDFIKRPLYLTSFKNEFFQDGTGLIDKTLSQRRLSGNYAGTYSGGSSGSWNAKVDVDGSLSATATGPFSGIGSVTYSGASTIPLRGTGSAQGFVITFGGTFTLLGGGPDVSAAGAWSSSSGQTGSWVGNKID